MPSLFADKTDDIGAIFGQMSSLSTLLALNVSAVLLFVSHLLAFGTKQSALTKRTRTGRVSAAKRTRKAALHRTHSRG